MGVPRPCMSPSRRVAAKVPLDEIELAVIQLPLPLLVGHPQGVLVGT